MGTCRTRPDYSENEGQDKTYRRARETPLHITVKDVVEGTELRNEVVWHWEVPSDLALRLRARLVARRDSVPPAQLLSFRLGGVPIEGSFAASGIEESAVLMLTYVHGTQVASDLSVGKVIVHGQELVEELMARVMAGKAHPGFAETLRLQHGVKVQQVDPSSTCDHAGLLTPGVRILFYEPQKINVSGAGICWCNDTWKLAGKVAGRPSWRRT